MIICENLISVTANTGTKIAACVRRAEDANGLAFALDLGVDALVVPEEALATADGRLLEAVQIAKAQRLERVPPPTTQQRAAQATKLALEPIDVLAVVDGGQADRVCVGTPARRLLRPLCAPLPLTPVLPCRVDTDLTSLLGDDEGCLLGSSAKALVLLHGETVASGFVPPRPFRVNAGPVHAYIMMADDSSKYLSELRAGDRVLVVSAIDGSRRAAVVGRCKVEPRPMLRVDFVTHGQGAEPSGPSGDGVKQLFLQQAETVRLAGVDGPIPVTSLRPNDRLLGRFASRGTHVGRVIDARVEER